MIASFSVLLGLARTFLTDDILKDLGVVSENGGIARTDIRGGWAGLHFGLALFVYLRASEVPRETNFLIAVTYLSEGTLRLSSCFFENVINEIQMIIIVAEFFLGITTLYFSNSHPPMPHHETFQTYFAEDILKAPLDNGTVPQTFFIEDILKKPLEKELKVVPLTSEIGDAPAGLELGEKPLKSE